MSAFKKIMIGGLVIVALFAFVSWASESEEETGRSERSSTVAETTLPTTVGSEAVIDVPSLDTVFLCVDKEAFDMFLDAALANDSFGVAELEISGRMFGVPNGTKVLIIDSSFATRRVRVLEGYAVGKSGWLPYEWLK